MHKQTDLFVEKQAISKKEAPKIYSINFFLRFEPCSYTNVEEVFL